MKLSKNMMVMGVFVLLLAVSLVQAVQLGDIRSNIDDLSVSKTATKQKLISTTSTSTSTSAGSGGVPTNLQNLPGMVGGC